MKIQTKHRPELCASTDSTRPALLSVFLKGNVLQATDGRRIVQIPIDREEGDVDGPIPVDVIKEARAVANKRASKNKRAPKEYSILSNGKTLKFESRFGILEIENLAVRLGNPPNTDAVIKPTAARKLHVTAFQPLLLLGVCEAMGCRSVTISFDDEASPILVEPNTENGCPSGPMYGVVMPVRTI